MTIHIIDEPPLYLTRIEHDRLRIEYDRMIMFMVDPPSFEEFVRNRRNQRTEWSDHTRRIEGERK